MNSFLPPRIILASVLLLTLATACGTGQRGHVQATLDDIGTYINERPDSALTVLRGIDSTGLKTRSMRARAALLHQKALDKCYIDIVTDSILSPADWYFKHGNATQKLETWYYHSVLARNAGDADEEMHCLVRAEYYIPRAGNPLMAGFVYTAKRVVFLNSFDLENAAVNAEKAVEAFRRTEESSRYHNALIGLANILSLQERYKESAAIIDSLKAVGPQLTANQRRLVCAIELTLLTKTGSGTELLSFINGYLDETAESQTDWTLVAQAYLACGSPDLAGQALERVPQSSWDGNPPLSYLKTLSDILHAAGRDEEALDAYRQFRELSDRQVEQSLASSVRFAADEEMFRKAESRKKGWLTVLVALCACLCATVLYARRRIMINRQTIGYMKGQLDNASSRVISLEEQVQKAENKKQIPPEAENLVVERINALNRYAASSIKGSSKALSELEAILSRECPEQFLEDITLQFCFLHPEFSRFLDQHTISGQERTFCILLAMGFQIKEISTLMSLSEQRCYNISNIIRKKMRLKEDNRTLQNILREKIAD